MAYKISILVLLSLLTAGCFAPAILTEKPPECQLATKKLKLTVSKDGSLLLGGIALEGMLSSHNCHTPECLLIIPLATFAVSATSMIVSGSIVVVGNSIHWIEKQGRCESSVTRTFVSHLTDSITAIGGKTIQSTTDLITWFKQRLQ
ncbi:MAG: hypothetical protein DRR08_15830 [Candidatus Parabeggiatoa sp. nov. 2]|nr:MAG: hypothetical protein B6247_14400 [Beggiatoa sp. 4572_84]RKZ58671.1 MAG: hypothetical protein DRR08_15830 [Gammaproteobacteria bacterium]